MILHKLIIKNIKLLGNQGTQKRGLVGVSEDGSFPTLKDSKIQLKKIRVKSNITYHIETQVY